MVTDLTKEHPDKTLWRFLLPMMLSVMFQQIYNIADSMIAVKFAGEDALAAAGRLVEELALHHKENPGDTPDKEEKDEKK